MSLALTRVAALADRSSVAAWCDEQGVPAFVATGRYGWVLLDVPVHADGPAAGLIPTTGPVRELPELVQGLAGIGLRAYGLAPEGIVSCVSGGPPTVDTSGGPVDPDVPRALYAPQARLQPPSARQVVVAPDVDVDVVRRLGVDGAVYAVQRGTSVLAATEGDALPLAAELSRTAPRGVVALATDGEQLGAMVFVDGSAVTAQTWNVDGGLAGLARLPDGVDRALLEDLLTAPDADHGVLLRLAGRDEGPAAEQELTGLLHARGNPEQLLGRLCGTLRLADPDLVVGHLLDRRLVEHERDAVEHTRSAAGRLWGRLRGGSRSVPQTHPVTHRS